MYANRKFAGLVISLTYILTACNSDNTVEPVADNESPFSLESKTQTEFFSVNIRTMDAMGIDAVEFSQGQQIYYELTITNLTVVPQIMTFPHAGFPAFCIRRASASDCIWDSQFEMVFTQATIETEFTEFEAQSYGASVEQVDNFGFAFGPGEYEIRGIGGSDSGLELLGSPWHSFTISD